MAGPPYAALADYATALGQLVPDTKAGNTDTEFVTLALGRLSEDSPCVEAADIGDGSTKTWGPLPTTSGAFDRFVKGFSERHPIDVEMLVAAAPVFEPQYLYEGKDFRIEERTGTAGAPELYLVFLSAPNGTNKVRVRFRRPWRVTTGAGAVNEVPTHLQPAVVYKAAELKCGALATVYASTVDLSVASDVFQADPTSERYGRRAAQYQKQYATVLGAGGKGVLAIGRVEDRPGRAWRQG